MTIPLPPTSLPDDPAAPFVLVEGAGGQSGRLYRDPVETVVARDMAQVAPALERLRAALRAGAYAAGYLAYEAGLALEPRLAPLARERGAQDAPLLWFGLFEGWQAIAPEAVPALLPEGGQIPTALHPLVSRADYAAAFGRVSEWIRAGDIYQANLTFPCEVALPGDMRALYRALRPRAAAPHGALLMTGQDWLLSFSPELFFTLRGGTLTARPMKGTAPRSDDKAQDARAAEALADDPKQRAENLMIVDLLRNDLSRVAQPGSVAVPRLFAIESYPTVHHMTSTVTARLREGCDAIDALAALFPCGSITGAPKLRAMEVIRAVEPHARGAYTGSIGTLDPSGDASFNVAIRTISAKDGAARGLLGLGSGIVADSRMDDEWRECLAKGRFVAEAQQGLDEQWR